MLSILQTVATERRRYNLDQNGIPDEKSIERALERTRRIQDLDTRYAELEIIIKQLIIDQQHARAKDILSKFITDYWQKSEIKTSEQNRDALRATPLYAKAYLLRAVCMLKLDPCSSYAIHHLEELPVDLMPEVTEVLSFARASVKENINQQLAVAAKAIASQERGAESRLSFVFNKLMDYKRIYSPSQCETVLQDDLELAKIYFLRAYCWEKLCPYSKEAYHMYHEISPTLLPDAVLAIARCEQAIHLHIAELTARLQLAHSEFLHLINYIKLAKNAKSKPDLIHGLIVTAKGINYTENSYADMRSNINFAHSAIRELQRYHPDYSEPTDFVQVVSAIRIAADELAILERDCSSHSGSNPLPPEPPRCTIATLAIPTHQDTPPPLPDWFEKLLTPVVPSAPPLPTASTPLMSVPPPSAPPLPVATAVQDASGLDDAAVQDAVVVTQRPRLF